MKPRPASPAECPVCGADLPPRARSCPDCGADERSGWNEEDSRYDGLDLPDSAFDENPAPRSRSSATLLVKRLLWPAVGLLLVALLLYRLLTGHR